MSHEEEVIPVGTVVSNSFFSRHKKGVITFGMALLLLFGGYFFWQFLKQPAQGTVRIGEQKGEESLEKSQKLSLYKGKYVDFLVKALYTEKSHVTKAEDPIKESILLSATDVEGRKIALVVADRGTMDLTNDPAVQMRQGAPREYQPQLFSVSSFHGTLFEKNTVPFEVTAFFVDQGFIISVSISSSFGAEGLKEELMNILQSLHFKGV